MLPRPLSCAAEEGVAMNEGLRISQRVDPYPLEPAATPRKAAWTWHAAGAVFGFAGGLVTVVAGSALTVISWVTGSEGAGSFLQRFATVLFLLTFPLLILGAHCLDLAEDESARRSLMARTRAEGAYGEPDSDYVN